MKQIRHQQRRSFHSDTSKFHGTLLGVISGTWMADELFIEPREEEYLEYEERATLYYQEFQASQTNNPDISMETARSNGVTNEWESYRFFANGDLNAPREVFNYIDDEGNNTYFTEKEIEDIRSWEDGAAKPVQNIEGHHVETVRENPTDTMLASDPDNIILATKEGHREHLHGGDTKNPTQEEYLQYVQTNDEKFAMTLDYNEDIITLNFWEEGAASSASSTIVYLTINEAMNLYRLKKDPRPWAQKKADALLSAKANTIIGLGLGTLSFITNETLTICLTHLSLVGASELFIEMCTINGTFFVMSIALATLNFIKNRQNGETRDEARKKYMSSIMTATAELIVFSVLGVGLEIGFEALGGLIVDAFIPDPTGILIALRAGYSIFKLGKKYYDSKQNQQAYTMCIELRQKHAYDLALKQF
ncbi:hypothetical protein [Bacillus sp. AK128]